MSATVRSLDTASVLIVDDEMGVRESLRLVLGSRFQVLTVDSGRRALETLRSQPVDVVTLDVSMPGLSGIETLKKIREIDTEVEVVMVTGIGSFESKRQAQSYRVFDWIVKPFDTKHFLGVVGGALERRRAHALASAGDGATGPLGPASPVTSDRRVSGRFAPSSPRRVTLQAGDAALTARLVEMSAEGCRIHLDHSADSGIRQRLADFLASGKPVAVDLGGTAGRQTGVLVWSGRSADGYSAGILFRGRCASLDGLRGKEATREPLLSARHRSPHIPRLTLTLRDFFVSGLEPQFSLDKTLQAVCEETRKLTAAETVSFWSLEQEDLILRAQSGRWQAAVGMRLPEGQGIPIPDFKLLKTTLQKKNQLFVNDLEHSVFADYPMVRRYAVKSLLMIPVFGRDTDFGVLILSHSENPYAFDAEAQADAEVLASQAALFVEKAQILARLEESAAFLEAMKRVVLGLHRSLDLDQLLELVCAESRKLFGVDFSVILLREGSAYVQRAASGTEQSDRNIEVSQIPLPEMPLLERGEAFFINHLEAHPVLESPIVRQLVHHRVPRSLMIVPIVDGSQTLGSLCLADAQHAARFTNDDLEKAVLFGEQVAHAISNAALFREKEEAAKNLKEWSDFLEAVNRIGLALQQHLSADHVLRVICDAGRTLFDVDVSTIYLRDGDELVQQVASGIPCSGRRLALSALREAAVIPLEEDFVANHLQQRPNIRSAVSERLRDTAQSLMAIRIWDEDSVIGTLTLVDLKHPDRFGEKDLERGKLLARHAAQALINARLYERVVQSKRLIAQRDRLHILGELAGVVTHEVRNALVPLRTLVELLPERYDDPEFRGWFADNIPREVRRMYELLNQLSRFRRVEERVVSSIDPAVLVASVVELANLEAAARGARLEVEHEPLPPISMVENPVRQILINLILNAIQAVGEGGLVRVSTRRSADGEQVLFAVRDDGPGIAPDQLERIFDPMFTTKPEGSGLGLSIARELAASNGGTIHVESSPGNGATFTLRLPAVFPQAAASEGMIGQR
jgi:signal transduction histidine kinase/DNA-binding response OmpR family regulator